MRALGPAGAKTKVEARASITREVAGRAMRASFVVALGAASGSARVRSWPPGARAQEDVERFTDGDAANGAKVYKRYCRGCHGADGRGGAHTFHAAHPKSYAEGLH